MMDINKPESTNDAVTAVLSVTLDNIEDWLMVKLPTVQFTKSHVNLCVVAQFISEQLEYQFPDSTICVASCAGNSTIDIDDIPTIYVRHDDNIKELIYRFDNPNNGSSRDDILAIIKLIRNVFNVPRRTNINNE